MKIVLATPMYGPEIAEPALYVREMALRLAAVHDVTIVAYGLNAEKIPGVLLVTVDKRRPLPLRLFAYTYALIQESRDADLVYAQSGIAGSLPTLVNSFFSRTRFIVRFTDDEAYERARSQNLTTKSLREFIKNPDGNLRFRMMILLQKIVLRRAHHIITSSHEDSDVLVHCYGVAGTKITTIYNPSPRPEIIPFPEKRTRHQIGIITKLDKTSGIPHILKAVKLLKETFPDLRVIIVGRGPEERTFRALAEKLMVARDIRFLPQISSAEMWHIRKTSQIFIHTPETSASPDGIVPCFNTKTPIIISNVPGLREAVVDNTSGLIVPPGDSEALAQAIKNILSDNTLQERLTKEGERTLAEQFSWEAHMGVFSQLCEEIRP